MSVLDTLQSTAKMSQVLNMASIRPRIVQVRGGCLGACWVQLGGAQLSDNLQGVGVALPLLGALQAAGSGGELRPRVECGLQFYAVSQRAAKPAAEPVVSITLGPSEVAESRRWRRPQPQCARACSFKPLPHPSPLPHLCPAPRVVPASHHLDRRQPPQIMRAALRWSMLCVERSCGGLRR
jgi:hypothetical protein